MDSDAIDASGLCSVYQPLDVLRLELQDEPAFPESSMPKDDHTLTFVPSTFSAVCLLLFFSYLSFFFACFAFPVRGTL